MKCYWLAAVHLLAQGGEGRSAPPATSLPLQPRSLDVSATLALARASPFGTAPANLLQIDCCFSGRLSYSCTIQKFGYSCTGTILENLGTAVPKFSRIVPVQLYPNFWIVQLYDNLPLKQQSICSRFAGAVPKGLARASASVADTSRERG